MAVAGLEYVDLDQVRDAVGTRSYTRGLDYARRNRVMKLAWDEGGETLVARVLGQGAIYETEGYFATDDNGFLDFLEGECSCPVGFNCKHVAAAVVAAVEATPTDVRAVGARAITARVSAIRSPQPALPTWEQSLQALLDVGSDRGAAEPASGPPLAIELRLDLGGPVKLMARIMRRGRNGWVNGGLSWNGLDSCRSNGTTTRPTRSGFSASCTRCTRALMGAPGTPTTAAARSRPST